MSLRNLSTYAGSPLPDSRVVELGPADLDRMIELEAATWMPGMQADRDMLAYRLELGHVMLGIENDGRLQGMIASAFTRFDPNDRKAFPRTFREYSTMPAVEQHNAAFVYTLHARPEVRGHGVPQLLMMAGRRVILENGCRYVVGDGRCPSYNGTTDPRCDSVEFNPGFHATLDQAVRDGELPPMEKLILDPVLRFYRRVLQCTFCWIMPDFVPEDAPSGGYRVIFYNEYEPQ